MTDYLDSELYLSSLDRACFTWGEDRNYEGRTALDYERTLEISVLENEPEAYGLELYDAVLPPQSDLRKGFLEAVFAAELEKKSLRFRLRLSPDLPAWVHALYWELLADPDPRRGALSRSPLIAFSRYSSLPQALGEPIANRPRLLCVVSAPSDVARFGMAEIDRGEVLSRFESLSKELAGEVEVEVLQPPAMLGRLRDRLMAKDGVHLLHFFGHGDSRGGGSALFLEDDQGRTKPVPEEMLAKLFLGAGELRLVTLIACHGGAQSTQDPFSGLAGRLVQQGVPAVLAMRRAVSFETGHVFTEHFYRHLARTRQFDAAVNEARNQLYLAKSHGIDWSSPVLYSRLKDGRLWLTGEDGADSPEESAPLLRLTPRRLLHPLPWVPAFFALLLVALGLLPVPKAEARFDLTVSQISFQLAKSARVVESLDLEEIAAAQLAAVRLPSLPAPSRWGGGGPGKGFLLNAMGPAQITLNPQPLPAGAKVTLAHQRDNLYRLAITESPQELRVTFQGEVQLKPLDGPQADLRLEHPRSLELYPRGGAVELDLAFAKIAPDAFSREISIDRLALHRIVEQHTPETTMVKEESTVLEGEVSLRGTGERHPLKKGEGLRFTTIAGSLTDLRIDKQGIRAGFQGSVSELERIAEGLEPESLMPAVLDLWIPGPAQIPVQGAAGALATAVLLLTLLEVRWRRRSANHPMNP